MMSDPILIAMAATCAADWWALQRAAESLAQGLARNAGVGDRCRSRLARVLPGATPAVLAKRRAPSREHEARQRETSPKSRGGPA
jgi:hypothetical protein